MGTIEYNKKRLAFEDAAKKKGYILEMDDLGMYDDNWLQEAWEVFMLIDLKGLSK